MASRITTKCHAKFETSSSATTGAKTNRGGTFRGGRVSSQQRGRIEEAKAALEAQASLLNIPQHLPGKWRVTFTTAPDLIPLVSGFPLNNAFQAREIYQEFAPVEVGTVENIINVTLPILFDSGSTAVVTVKADYEVISNRRLALKFQRAEVGQVNISPAVEAVLAPAILPRGPQNHQLLLAIKEFHLGVPLSRRSQSSTRGTGEFLLNYLDEDTLIGTQTMGGGYFIFDKC